MYALYPGHALRAARAAFPDYAIFQLHDHTGAAEYTAVCKRPYRDPGAPVLLTAGTLGELVSELRDGGSPPLFLVPAPRPVPTVEGGPDAA